MGKVFLDVNHLTVRYGNYDAIRDVSFQVEDGDFINIIGPNGGGKTTLIKSLIGLVTPSSGSIEVSPVVHNRIGYLPQKGFLNDPSFPATVEEVLYTGILQQAEVSRYITKEHKQQIDQLLLKMDVYHLKKRLISSLSGGQQQRIFIIRAMLSNPKILVLDEPTTALDPDFRKSFSQLLKKINLVEQMTIINVTHELDEELKRGSKVLHIDQTMRFFGSYESFKLHSKEMKNYV